MIAYKLWLIVFSKNDHGVLMHSAYRMERKLHANESAEE